MTARPLRPTWVEIDLGALRRNLRLTRRLVGPKVKIYAVMKGDAYGIGAAAAAPIAAEEGADALAVADPADASTIRRAGVSLPILLYGCTAADAAEAVADLDLMVTLFDDAGIEAYGRLGRAVTAFAEIDAGFGRLGFTPEAWPNAIKALGTTPTIRLRGLYTHLGALDDTAAILRQVRRFDDAVGSARAAGFGSIERMAASSRVALAHSDLHFDAIDPGRMLYGLIDGELAERVGLSPVIRAVKSRLVQVKDLAADMRLGYGDTGRNKMRGAVAPIGFVGGWPRRFRSGYALVRGTKAPIVGLASMEHMLFDVSAVPGAGVGDEVVLLGRQGEESITPERLHAMTDIEPLELLQRLARNLPRVYVG
jgi:alanine racemase